MPSFAPPTRTRARARTRSRYQDGLCMSTFLNPVGVDVMTQSAKISHIVLSYKFHKQSVHKLGRIFLWNCLQSLSTFKFPPVKDIVTYPQSVRVLRYFTPLRVVGGFALNYSHSK